MDKSCSQAGLLYAISAFSLWGFLPVYFKVVDSVPPLEVLGHRVLWSALLLLAISLATGKLGNLLDVAKKTKVMGFLALSSLLIGSNWLVFIWGVVNNHILEISLGYYINPLVTVLFGYIFLGERLNRVQIFAIALATVAVCLQIFWLGSVPWIAFVLALTFGFYGLVRKQLNVQAVTGLTVETLFLLPVVTVYFLWLWQGDKQAFRLDAPEISVLLMMAGVFTTVPLILFNLATHRLSLTVIGVTQYLGPSISFLVGVLIYNEPLKPEQIVTFALIWLALAIFTSNGIYRQFKNR